MSMSQWLEQAVQAAQAGGELIREALQRGGTAVRYKGPANPVTEIDEASQALIRGRLLASNPEHAFLGEEGGGMPSHEAEWMWVVDPLDGTKNFAHGYPHVCVSIALQQSGQSVLGVIHDPMRLETFTSVRGQGAFLNHRPISVSRTDSLRHSLLVTGFAAGHEAEHQLFSSLEIASEGVRRDGSAALNLAYVAAGRLDGFFQLNLSPWDVAAGALLVQEAQGTVTDYFGGQWNCNCRQLLASNTHLHRAMLDHTERHRSQVERALRRR
jgi:myo-inositol-1(or 4)-monophosphatase